MSPQENQQSPEKATSNQSVGATDSSASLSSAVFDNPKEFLEILRDHHKEITRPGTDYATRQDYFYAAEHAKDPKLRAAAEIVGKHFDEIAKFDAVAFTEQTDNNPNGISSRDIQYALKFLSGNYKPTLYWEETKSLGLAAFGVAGTALMGTFTVLALEAPPLAALFGAGTLATGGVTGIWGYDAYTYPSNMHAKAADSRLKLTSWPEINKELRK